MNTENYIEQQAKLPKKGKHIVAQSDGETLVVYQAYNDQIAKYAVANQQFGGAHFSLTRMTWIKPNFMWMMYRAGWATKKNQTSILAIRLKKAGFDEILRRAVPSSFAASNFPTNEAWKNALAQSDVRLQWDPDHSPTGQKLERRAIQLGLKGTTFHQFNEEWIVEITDITAFVKEQAKKINSKELQVPVERRIDYSTELEIQDRIGL